MPVGHGHGHTLCPIGHSLWVIDQRDQRDKRVELGVRNLLPPPLLVISYFLFLS